MELKKVSPIGLLAGFTFNAKSSRLTPRRRSSSTPSPPGKRLSTWPSPSNLTPYAILGLRPGDSSSKSRFYELVKVYHPDRASSTPTQTLCEATRIERYRLIIAANEILINPTKRRAYDQFGIGWPHSPITGDFRDRRPYPDLDSDGGSAKSTRLEQDLQHRRFIVLAIVIFFFLQSCFLEVLNLKNETGAKKRSLECYKLLESRRGLAIRRPSSDAQMEGFLLKRDPSGLGLSVSEEPAYRMVLPYCTPGRV
ncbi:Hsp40 co-chaperone Jid1 [Aspergillus sclerotialis]|uniref:Hsp40 co-chaperone Jid1 n=1 Tax=Aspergillus sclerotialis TaxID=2070753 RepID=A0A3A2ZCJ9_9EURO|nr:Hsp40 co-chaperone Jid1 [Aspergillus sclerotialis]